MKERIKSVDSMRGIAILAVLLIHTTTRTLEASGFDIRGYTWTLFLNQIARFAVPLFFVMSGFVLEYSHKEEESYFTFLKKRVSKILIPYVFWSAFYYLLVYNQNHDNFLDVILTGNASYQLYFIPTLFIFYLIFPILHKFYRFLSNIFSLLILGTGQVYLLYLDYFVKDFRLPDPVHIAILAYFFFIIGIVAAKNKNKIDLIVKKFKYSLIGLTSLSGLYVFWEGRERYLAANNFYYYYSQWRPSTLIYTFLLALTLYYLFEYTKLKDSFIYKFSKHSFLVFFIHVAILEEVWRVVGINVFNLIGAQSIGKYIFDPIFFALIAFISFLFALSLHKISRSFQLMG